MNYRVRNVQTDKINGIMIQKSYPLQICADCKLLNVRGHEGVINLCVTETIQHPDKICM